MAPLSDTSNRDEHDDLVRAAVSALPQVGWRTASFPVVGTVQPDLLAVGPSGEYAVIELKASARPLHFGAVAQVAALSRAAEEVSGHSVDAILVTTSPVSSAAADAAANLDVTVLELPSTNSQERASECRSLLTARLQRQSKPPTPARSDDPPKLTARQLSALEQAASKQLWPPAVVNLLAAQARRTLMSGTRRMPLTTPDEWLRFYDQVAEAPVNE